MVEFELLDRDGLARIGRFDTPHGRVETPALLPVVHPDPTRQPVSTSEIRRRFGLGAVITSSYITWRTPALREAAQRTGIHGLLDFDGPVMTDSGAFQQHAYGHVEVGPEEILEFQNGIGSDIATVLDVFVEPGVDHAEAEAGVGTTIERARAARRARPGLLAVPVQGGAFDDLRARSAREASALGDVLAIGGVVPLFEQYRFAELARTIASARPHLSPGRVVHLFGTGHPMTFAFAALFGVDLFDSSAYHKFARRGRLLFPEGSIAIDELRERTCRCALCEEIPLPAVAKLEPVERERRIAEHNLLTSAAEMGVVRQAIRDGTLWELVERRATAHPALRAGLSAARGRGEVFFPTEPASRRAFRETGPSSYDRPAVRLFREHLARYTRGLPPARTLPRIALSPDYLSRVPLATRTGEPLRWESETPFGRVPVELLELYPIGPCLSSAEFESMGRRTPSDLTAELRATGSEEFDLERDWTEEWTDLEVRSRLLWQYGSPSAEALARHRLRGQRSRRTGRLRGILAGDIPVFQIGNDGLPRPSFRGAEMLRAALPPPRARVIVHADAIGFVREGRSLFSRFALGADADLRIGETGILVDAQDALLAVGRLLLAPHEMSCLRRGVAVRVTAHAKRPHEPEEADPDEA